MKLALILEHQTINKSNENEAQIKTGYCVDIDLR